MYLYSPAAAAGEPGVTSEGKRNENDASHKRIFLQLNLASLSTFT